jgi:hypothetical protein
MGSTAIYEPKEGEITRFLSSLRLLSVSVCISVYHKSGIQRQASLFFPWLLFFLPEKAHQRGSERSEKNPSFLRFFPGAGRGP